MHRQPHITKFFRKMVTTLFCFTDLVICWLLTVNLGKRPDCENLYKSIPETCALSATLHLQKCNTLWSGCTCFSICYSSSLGCKYVHTHSVPYDMRHLHLRQHSHTVIETHTWSILTYARKWVSLLTWKYLSSYVSFPLATTRSQSRKLFFFKYFFVRYFRYLHKIMFTEFLYNETSQSRPDIMREHTQISLWWSWKLSVAGTKIECLQNVWIYTGSTNDPVSMCTGEILALYLLR
jgi:hypothetical protein